MRRSPTDVDSGPPADERGVSFATLLAGGFLAFLGFILVAGILGPMIGFRLEGSSSPPTPEPASLESADAPDAPRANASASLNATEVAQVERLIVAYANGERADYNHMPLVRNSNLANISRAHSYDMAARKYYSHYDPEGHGPGIRTAEAGYSCPAVGENIANLAYNRKAIDTYGEGLTEYTTPRELAKALVGRWMQSGGHRWAILEPKYDVIGVGIYVRGDDQVYATMMLCDRRHWPNTPPEGMAAPVADPGADYNESYWEPYPDSVNASWDDDPPTATPTNSST